MSGCEIRHLVTEELAAANIAIAAQGALRGRPRHTEWDAIVPGFGVRQYASGRQVWIIQALSCGRTITVTIGNAAVIKRKLARDIARRVKLRAQAGEDPAKSRKVQRSNPTFVDFVAQYFRIVGPTWKPSTRATNHVYRRHHIDGSFPGLYIDEITPAQVLKWFVERTDNAGPGGANRVHAIMRHMFNKAEEWGMRPEGSNPCVGIKLNRGKVFERYLSEQELARLGEVLARHEAAFPVPIGIIRLLLLTACRYSEIANLVWGEVARNKLKLADTKSGARTVWLGWDAVALLRALPRGKPDNLVFANPRTGRAYKTLSTYWFPIRKEAGLGRLRLHDLRHSFASHAAAASETLPMIGKLLGHAKVDTTARYAHLDDGQLLDIAERIGNLIDKALQVGRQEGWERRPAV